MTNVAKIFLLIAAVMILTPLDGFAKGQGRGAGADNPGNRAQVERGQTDRDRDRMRDQDRTNNPAHDRDRDQDRTNAPDHAKQGGDQIYGHELMSVEEQNQYREQLRLVDSDSQEQTRLKAQHREEMNARAKAQGVKLDPGAATEAPE